MIIRLLHIIFAVALLFALSACREEASYFPPHRDQGDWRKNTSKEFVESLGLDHEAMQQFGKIIVSAAVLNSAIPGYDDHNHAAALVIKNGWIVGEWYLRPESRSFQQYLSSNGKTFMSSLLTRNGLSGPCAALIIRIYARTLTAGWEKSCLRTLCGFTVVPAAISPRSFRHWS